MGGGNIKSICSNMNENIANNMKPQETETVLGLTTTEDQRQIFISNIESQVNNLKNSSSGLKNQNNKLSFSQSVNWISSNQLVVFDIMIGLKSNDNDIIQIFEESIIKMLQAVMNVLKKSKNIYLAYIISNQTAVLATSVYRFYLSHPIDSNKQLRIQKMKSQLIEIMESLFLQLDQFNKSDVTINYLEQSLKLIESFGLSLPEQNFSPILNFASGFAQMVAFGGTRGWDQMISGIKDGVTQLVNKQLHQEQMDIFVMYTTLERIKYSIIKILLDDQQQNDSHDLDSIQSSVVSFQDNDLNDDPKEKQIVETLQTIGKTVENSQKWGYKYFFVQMLGELILYQSQIDAKSLEQKLSTKKFPFKLDIEQLWDILLKNNWVIGFKLGQDEQDKIGLLSKTRNTLDNLNMEKIVKKIQKKQKKNKSDQKQETDISEDQIKDEFIKQLNEILEEYEPITKRISNIMLNGSDTFKGLMGYCFEGLDQSSAPKSNIIDKFANKDPIQILEISFKQINNFALDFFNSQFTVLTKMTEKQLKNLFIGIINDYKDDIVKHIFASGAKFNSIANTNQSVASFQTFANKFIAYGQVFIDKILEYLPKFFDSLQLIQQVTGKIQDIGEFSDNINNYIINSINFDLKEISNQLIPLIQELITMLNKIINSFISDSKFVIKPSTLNKYILKFEQIQLTYNKITQFSQLLEIQSLEIIEPEQLQHLKILNKKLHDSNEKDSNLNYYNQKIREIFTNNSMNSIQQKFVESILNCIDDIELKIQQYQQNLQQNKILNFNLFDSKTFFYLNLIDNSLKSALNSYTKIKQDLEDFKTQSNKQNIFTFALQWIQNIDNNIKEFIKQNSDSNFETLKQFIEDQQEIILSNELEEECKNTYLNKNQISYKIFFDLQQLGSFIFQKQSDNEQQEKLKNPDSYNNMILKLISVMEIPLNLLKNFMNSDLDNIKETVLDDIQVQFKEFLNSPFSQDLTAALTGLRSISNTENIGSLFSSLTDKYSDQNWRIRERVVLILFDLNRVYGGEDGDQTFANTLIHMKAKDTNPKVQQTLKNEEMLIEMKSILSSNWKSQENEIKEYIKAHFAELDEQVKKMKEDKSIDKDKILKYYEKKENQLNQQLENISEIGSLAGIQLEFMKDMKKQLFKLQQQVEEIKDSLKTIGSNILLLKGKSVYQLFEDRKKKIEEEEDDKKAADVHIQLRGSQYLMGKKNEYETFEFIAPDFIDDFYEYQVQIKNINSQQSPEKQDSKQDKQEIEINKKSSLITEYISQVIADQNPEMIDQIKQKQKISEFMKSKTQKYILDEFYQHKYNSLLIHGQPGSGKSRLCQQIEYTYWQNRKMQKLHIYQKIKKNEKLQEIFQEFTINQLYQIMQDYNFIDQKGFFTSFFIEFESELEDIKAANRIVNESWGEDEKNEDEEEETYELTDIQSESAENLFQKKLTNMFQNYDKIFVSAIYDLLDGQFQNKPFPIITKLSQLNQPNKDLLRETLSMNPYDFDEGIIRKIRDLSQMGDIKLVFIIDGYNEMKQELQGLNLFTTNGLELLKSTKDRAFTYPKVITTCRSNFLSEEDYQTYFQNIFQRKQKIPYKPDQYYLEYQMEDLNYLQIQQYFKEKFLVSLKSICISIFEKKFNSKKFGKNVLNCQLTEFAEIWNAISYRANDAQEFNKLWMGKPFIEFIVEIYQKKVEVQILNQISQEEYNKFKFDLTKVYTQAMYEKIVKKTNLNFLLNNVLMMNIFIEAMEKLMQKLNSEADIKLRIKSAIQQEDVLKNYPNLSIDIIISLLCKGEQDLIKNFSLSYDRKEIEQQIQKLICKNNEIASNNEFSNHLSSLIIFAMYSQDITRYRLYDTFYANYIKKQIKILKDSGQLMVTQGVMLKDCKLYSKRLAAAFHENDKEIFKRLDQSQLYSKKSIWDEFFDDVELPIRKQARQCLPFVCSGIIFHFMHYSIKDFIMAHEYFDTINHFKIDIELFESLVDYKIQKYGSQSNISEEFQKLLSQEEMKNSIIIQQKTNEDGIKLQDKALIEFVIQQTKDAMQQEMKQTLENLKLEISDLKKSFAQTQNLVIKQEVKQEKQSFMENLMNNEQELESFLQFYIKKSNKKITSLEIKEKIQKFLDSIQKVIDQSLNKTQNLYNHKNKGICDFLKDKLRMVELPDPNNQLFRNLNYLIKLGRLDQKCSNSAANAIGLMIYNNNCFNRIDFSGMDIQGINLYGGKFIKCIFNSCNMEGANLSKSVLYKCKFSNTNLNNAIFQNCIMNRSTFSKSRLNDIQLGRDLDIYYSQFLEQNDKLVHIMVDPTNSKSILSFHKQSVFRINIDHEQSVDHEQIVKQIKKFDKKLCHKAGMIKYSKKPNQYIVGVENSVFILDIEQFNFVDQISNLPIDKIECVQYNDISGDILIGGLRLQDNQKYIIIGQFQNDFVGTNRILTDECNIVQINKEINQIICHYQDKTLKQFIVLCFNMDNYQQTGQKQILTQNQKLKKYGNLKKANDIQLNRFLIHPCKKFENISISLNEIARGIHEISVEKDEEIVTKEFNPNGTYTKKVTKNKALIDSIRIHILDQKKYGKADQILINQQFPKLIICAYKNGLIRRFQIQSLENKDSNFIDTQIQIPQISFSLQMRKQNNEILSCYINNKYDSVIQLVKFHFNMNKDHTKFEDLQIIQTREFKTRNKNLLDKKDSNIKNQIIGMMTHKTLLQEFILIVLENKNKIIKFIINRNLNLIETNKIQSMSVLLSELTKEAKLFNKFSIHSENHSIFCFSFNQIDSKIPSKIVIYNLEQRQILINLAFDQIEQSLSKLYFESASNFRELISYNRLGDIKIFNDIQYNEQVQNNLNVQGFPLTKKKSQQQDDQFNDQLQEPNLKISLQPKQKGSLTKLLGKHPQKRNIIVTYDYLDNTISKYDVSNGEVNTTQVQAIKQTKKKGKCSHNDMVNFHKKVLDEILDHYKMESFDQILKKDEEKLFKIFEEHVQIILHPTFPLVFMIFKEQQHMAIYSLDKNTILDFMEMAFYFDPSVQTNLINYVKNPNIFIYTYSQTIKVVKYMHNEEKQQDIFETIYQKYLQDPTFQCLKTKFDDCIMSEESKNILYQNGARILED